MVKQLVSDLKIHWKWNLLTLLIVPGCFLFGMVMLVLLMQLPEGPDSLVSFGSMLGLGFTFMFSYLHYTPYHQEFMLALSMGRTRREFILSYALRRLLWLAAGYLLTVVFSRVELALNALCFPGFEYEFSPDYILNWQIFLPLLVVLTLLHLFLGSLYSRFGKTFAMIWIFAWMGFWLLYLQLIPDEEHEASFLLNALSAIPATVWIILAVAIVAAMLVTVIHLGRKQQVR